MALDKIYYPHRLRLEEARPEFSLSSDPSLIPQERNTLYLLYTSGVHEEEVSPVLRGIKKIINEVQSKIELINLGVLFVKGGPIGNADWYRNQTCIYGQRNNEPQVNITRIGKYLSQEPIKRYPYMSAMLFEDELTSDTSDISYGVAAYPNFFMSMKIFRYKFDDLAFRQDALAITAAHELGHNFGLVGRNFNWRKNAGYHCNGECGPCLMEQVDGPGLKSLQEQLHLIIDRTRWLCEDCTNEANYKKWDLECNGITW